MYQDFTPEQRAARIGQQGQARQAQWNALAPTERATRQAYADRQAAEFDRKVRSSQRFGNLVKRGVQTVVAVGTGYGLGTALAGGGAVAAPGFASVPGAVSGAPMTAASQAAAFGTPTVVGTGTTMASRIPWWNIASKGVDTLAGIYGSRKQDAADRRSTDYLRTRDAEALAWDRELEARRRMEHDAEQAERRQQWDAMQKFEAAKWAAMEEERLHARALADAKEARQAPYRAASLSALNNLPSLWASGAQSPGLGSLGSYRGGGE